MTFIFTYIVMLPCFISKRDAQVTDPMPFMFFNFQWIVLVLYLMFNEIL